MHNKIIFGVFVFAAVWASMDAGQFVLNAESIVVRAAESDPLLNGGFEDSWEGGPAAAYDWQTFQNGYTRSSEVSHSGEWSIRLENSRRDMFSGAYQRVDLDQDSVKPVFVGGWVKGENIFMNPGSWFGASIYAEVHFKDGSVGYWNSVPNSGTFDWRWIGFNTGAVSHLQKPIDYIFIVPILGNASGVAYLDDITVTPIEPSAKSAVTIMFDDGEATDFTVAKPVLDSYGYKGTSAVPVGDLGQPGNMTVGQVQELQTSGWEIVSHAINNDTNLITDLTPAQAASAIADSKTQLESLGLTIQSIAWPFGAYNAELIGDAQADGYVSTRPFETGDNPQGAFPHEIKVRQVKSTTTVAEVEQWLAEGKANNRWEILAFHTIASSGDDEYHNTPEQFSQMIAAVAASGMPVVTYNEGLKEFAMGGGPTTVKKPVSQTNSPEMSEFDDLVCALREVDLASWTYPLAVACP